MLMQFMTLGGPLMWPLLACSVALGAVLFERAWTVGVVHLMLGGATRKVDAAGLAWHRRALPFFVDVPPSIGLLGTVVGVIRSFNLGGGGIDTDAVASGLGVACITTVFGLSIAIVASIARHALDWITGQPEPGLAVPEAGGLTMAYKSFIDLLFILLLSTFVLLSESVRMQTVDANPAEVEGGGSVVTDAAEAVQVAVLPEGRVLVDGVELADAEAAAAVAPGAWVLLVPGAPEAGDGAGLDHQRVMEAWSTLRAAGLDVRLGVKPTGGASGGGG